MTLVRNLDVHEINTALLSLQNLLRNGGKSGSDNIYNTYNNSTNKMNDVTVGTICSYLGNTDPSDGKWLICDGRDTTGTAIELETHYPSLYMFLGGTNVLPEIFDHSRPSAWETITISTNSASPTIMEYDGVIYVQASRSGSQTGHNVRIFINGTEYKSSLDTSATNYWTAFMELPVKKGDSVYTTYTGTLDKMLGCFYKSHKIIKATSSVDYYHAPSSEIAQIEQYFDNGLNTVKNNALSYSTEETLTGGKWIDGKPIYRKVIEFNSETTIAEGGTNFTLATLGLSEIDNVFNIYAFNTTGSKTTKRRFSNIPFYWSNDTTLQLRAPSSITGYFLGLILEYTKTTD